MQQEWCVKDLSAQTLTNQLTLVAHALTDKYTVEPSNQKTLKYKDTSKIKYP